MMHMQDSDSIQVSDLLKAVSSLPAADMRLPAAAAGTHQQPAGRRAAAPLPVARTVTARLQVVRTATARLPVVRRAAAPLPVARTVTAHLPAVRTATARLPAVRTATARLPAAVDSRLNWDPQVAGTTRQGAGSYQPPVGNWKPSARMVKRPRAAADIPQPLLAELAGREAAPAGSRAGRVDSQSERMGRRPVRGRLAAEVPRQPPAAAVRTGSLLPPVAAQRAG